MLKGGEKVCLKDLKNYKNQKIVQDELASAEDKINNSPKTVSNIDLLKRISQLEKAVFGKSE